MGHTLMLFIKSHDSGIVLWHLAQMSFSLMLAVAFTASGGYGMPFLAIGLWKFGFHETVQRVACGAHCYALPTDSILASMITVITHCRSRAHRAHRSRRANRAHRTLHCVHCARRARCAQVNALVMFFTAENKFSFR